MMKALMQLIFVYTQKVLGMQAEAGPQLAVPGYQANSDYSGLSLGNQYIIVAHIGQYAAIGATDANSSTILGVMQNNPKIGEAMSISCAGVSKVQAGAALTAGAIFTANASARAVVVTSGDMAVGRALETAGADGDVITAMLFHPIRWGQVA